MDYVGKHAKKWYRVWRVLGPGGPQEEINIFGKQEAEALCEGCWDWEIEPMTPDGIIRGGNTNEQISGDVRGD